MRGSSKFDTRRLVSCASHLASAYADFVKRVEEVAGRCPELEAVSDPKTLATLLLTLDDKDVVIVARVAALLTLLEVPDRAGRVAEALQTLLERLEKASSGGPG